MSSKTDLSVTDPLEGGPYFNNLTPPSNFRYDDVLNTEGYKFPSGTLWGMGTSLRRIAGPTERRSLLASS
jgi:hypothetical protein